MLCVKPSGGFSKRQECFLLSSELHGLFEQFPIREVDVRPDDFAEPNFKACHVKQRQVFLPIELPEQIDIRIGRRLASGNGPEQRQANNPGVLEFGLVFAKSRDDVVSVQGCVHRCPALVHSVRRPFDPSL
jgi:hypothetical protein